uniref:Uncharacterized protein n=1 Tax=Rhizophora mucronata TaxID=61149 RepID=A0A2P2NKK8_RHIMU
MAAYSGSFAKIHQLFFLVRLKESHKTIFYVNN